MECEAIRWRDLVARRCAGTSIRLCDEWNNRFNTCPAVECSARSSRPCYPPPGGIVASWRHAVVVSGTQSASRSRVSCGRGGRPYRSCRICPQTRLCARLTKTRAFRAKERMQESRESPMESRSIGLFPSRSQRSRLSTPWSDAWLPIGRQIGVPIGTDAREQLESSWASNPLFHCHARWATLSPVSCTGGQRNPTDPSR